MEEKLCSLCGGINVVLFILSFDQTHFADLDSQRLRCLHENAQYSSIRCAYSFNKNHAGKILGVDLSVQLHPLYSTEFTPSDCHIFLFSTDALYDENILNQVR